MEPSSIRPKNWIDQFNNDLTTAYLKAVDELKDEEMRKIKLQTTKLALIHLDSGLVRVSKADEPFWAYRCIKKKYLDILKNSPAPEKRTEIIQKLAKKMALYPTRWVVNCYISKDYIEVARRTWEEEFLGVTNLKNLGVKYLFIDPDHVVEKKSGDNPETIYCYPAKFIFPNATKEDYEKIQQEVNIFLDLFWSGVTCKLKLDENNEQALSEAKDEDLLLTFVMIINTSVEKNEDEAKLPSAFVKEISKRVQSDEFMSFARDFLQREKIALDSLEFIRKEYENQSKILVNVSNNL